MYYMWSQNLIICTIITNNKSCITCGDRILWYVQLLHIISHVLHEESESYNMYNYYKELVMYYMWSQNLIIYTIITYNTRGVRIL